MKKESKIYIAGHKGLVGSHLFERLKNDGYQNLITKNKEELNLLNQKDVLDFFRYENIDYVFLAAAKVGGIFANMTKQADFIYENLQIQNNIIHSSYLTKVKKLLFLGSSCIYPKECSQPIKEEYLLTGPLEQTNYGYAIAKIAGLKMCQAYNEQYDTNFISVMPTNLYGPRDNFDLQNSHVLPALIRKFHEAKIRNEKTVTIWGDGKPEREFLYAEDLADACVFLMNDKNVDRNTGLINIGTGEDISIKDLAFLIKDIIDFKGDLIFDKTKPNGTMKKVLNVNKINNLGWKAKTDLKTGILKTYEYFKKNNNAV